MKDFEKSKFFICAKMLKEKVEMGDSISDKELEELMEVLNEIRNFALGYNDKILLTWSSMAILPLEHAKFHRGFR